MQTLDIFSILHVIKSVHALGNLLWYNCVYLVLFSVVICYIVTAVLLPLTYVGQV